MLDRDGSSGVSFPILGFDRGEPPRLDLEDQYRRSEEPYSGPEAFSAAAFAAWDDDALSLAVEVTKPDVSFRPPDAPPLRLDNDPDDVHSDGLQLYLRDPEGGDVTGFLVVPEGKDGARLRARGAGEAPGMPDAIRGTWRRTREGYRVTPADVRAMPFRPRDGERDAKGSTSSSTRCFPAGSAGRGSSCGAAATAGCGCVETGRIRSGSGCWSWWDEANAKVGTRNAERQGERRVANGPCPLFRVPRFAFRVLGFRPMSVVVVLHEPQELVNIAHVVRALKNFGFRDLRLVRPREYDAFRVEGIAHQTQDILARVTQHERLEDALADCVHVVGFTSRGRSARRNQQRPRPAAAEILARSEVGVVALLFGREDKGLANDALDRCHRVVTIPTNPDYPSLNLAHAAVLMLYKLALARGDELRALTVPH